MTLYEIYVSINNWDMQRRAKGQTFFSWYYAIISYWNKIGEKKYVGWEIYTL